MSDHIERAIEQAARAEAVERWPALNPDDEDVTYSRSTVREFARGGFTDGAVWAVEHLRIQGLLAPAPLREEQRSAHTVRETAAHYANRLQRLRDQIMDSGYRRSVVDVIALESAEQFLDRIARDDLDVFTVDRAEGDGRADQ